MKEFITAVAAVEDNEEGNDEGWVDFKVDGQECRARRPSSGQVAYLTSTTHRHAPLQQKVAGVINFCMAVMDEDTAAYLNDKLLDGDDPFEIPQIQDIIEYLIEQWSGRPTEQSSGSRQPQDSTGSTSTESALKSTSLASASTGS